MSLQFQTASRNSFQNLIKPDITKVELLKDVHSKKDLIIRLVTHDTDPRVSENKIEESLTSDEDEVVLQKVMKELPEVPFEDQVKEDMKPITSTVAFAKPLMSKRNLKKILSLGKYCHPKSTATTTNTEASPTQRTESEETQQRTVSKPDVTKSKSSTVTDSSFSERKTQLSVSDKCDYQWPGFYRKGTEFHKLSPSNLHWIGRKGHKLDPGSVSQLWWYLQRKGSD